MEIYGNLPDDDDNSDDENDDFNNNNTGSIEDNGEGGGGTIIPPIQTRTDCPDLSYDTVDSISDILKSYKINDPTYGIFDMQSVDVTVNSLRNFAKNSSYEYGSTINFGDERFFTSFYGSTLTITTNLSSTSLGLSHSENTVMFAHTHPMGALSSPSPLDAILLAKAYNNGAYSIYCNVVFAANGSEHIVYVYDRTAFTSFCDDLQNASFFEQNGSYFKTGSIYETEYISAYNSLLDMKYTQSIANSYALSYVLDKYNTGIKIAARPTPNHQFKEQKTNFINNQYQPSKCP